MGFYGNITNTSNTTFSFDRIYPNKQSMDANVNNDGIFIGRYVLVEYDQDAAYPVVYKKPNENRFYSSKNFEQATEIKLLTGEQADEYKLTEDDSVISGKQYYKKENNKYIAVSLNSNDIPSDLGLYEYVSTADGVYKGEIVQVQTIQTDNNGNLITILIDFYECVGGSDGIAQFDQIGEEPNAGKSNYIKNFAIDEKHLNGEQQKSFKGYDSTVWMKSSVTASDGKLITKYVNIADLNSVVPTFDIAEDAPTMNALTPHFDADSTNVYYKLHMQTPYGFRVKQVDNGKGSDLKTQHIKATYDINNNMIGKSAEEVNADIYYNKAGFKEETSSFKENGSDIITILPSGDSGKTYKHTPVLPDNMKDTENWDGDIQELSIRLPSIGNTISKIWDIVYDNTEGYSGDNGTRKRDLDWQYVINDKTGELRVPQKGGKTLELNTIAGCINNIHNLMGQIIVGNKPAANSANKNYIYFDNIKYWKIVDEYKYTELTGNINKNTTYYVISDANNIFTKGTIWNNKVTTIPTGVKIGTRTTINAWKELDLGKHFDTLHGQILQLNQAYSNALIDSETRNDNTIIGNINHLNDIIAKFSELVPGEIMVIDEYGRMHSAEYSTAQEYTSKNYGKSIDGEDTDSYEATEDRWINLNINTDYTNPSIKLVHNFTEVTDTTTTSDKNGIINGNGINNNTDNKLRLYAPIVDSMGHVVGKNIETVTLPYGYKTFTTNGRGNDTDDANDGEQSLQASVVADSTQDSLALNSGNKWIRIDTDANNDIITFSHDVHVITNNITEETTDNLNNNKNNTIQNTINIPDWAFDNAGHITHKSDRIYTLPFGYKTFTDGTNNSVANSTQDTFAFVGDSWLKPTVNEDQITYTHIGPVNGTDLAATSASPKFKGTFDIITWEFDKLGHKNQQSKQTITLPTLIKDDNNFNSTGYSLISNLEFVNDNDQGQKLQVTRKLVGDVPITNYELMETSEKLNAQDTINQAFSKLQKQIIIEENTRKAEIEKLLNGASTEELDSIMELVNWVNEHDTVDMPALVADIKTNAKSIEQEITNRKNITDNLKSAAYTETTAYDASGSAATAEQNAKDYADGLASNYATADQGTLAEKAIQPGTTFTYGTEPPKTIQELMTIVNAQAEAINSLQNQINELKNPQQQPDNGGDEV